MTAPAPGPRNLITDVAGLTVGNAADRQALSGVTVVLAGRDGAVAAADVRGGAPGSRELALLDPACMVERVHGVVLAGGSVFGLDAAGGVVSWLAANGVGFTFGDQPLPCPVVPSAILFDLTNGGDKAWGPEPPYRRLGIAAADAAGRDFALGNEGAGLGATAGLVKGGLGSASAVVGGVTVGALVAANPFGSCIDAATGALHARRLAHGDEAGPAAAPAAMRLAGTKADAVAGANTTIAVVACDAALGKAEARRLAIMAGDGLARAIAPIHTPFDGDTVIALATGRVGLAEPRPRALAGIGAAAADCLTRAVGRAVWEARSIGRLTAYRDAASLA